MPSSQHPSFLLSSTSTISCHMKPIGLNPNAESMCAVNVNPPGPIAVLVGSPRGLQNPGCDTMCREGPIPVTAPKTPGDMYLPQRLNAPPPVYPAAKKSKL